MAIRPRSRHEARMLFKTTEAQAPLPHTTRRQLLQSLAIFGGAVVTSRGLVACLGEASEASDDEGDVGASSDELVRCTPPVISANHGHSVVVPAADVTAAVTKTYSIQGSSGHDHTITITKAQFVQLAGGASITVRSTSGAGHTHDVKVTCTSSSSTDAGRPDGSATADSGASRDAHADARTDARADASSSTCPNGASASTITANHGHTLKVSAADVASGSTKTYSIKGSSSHDHQVTISSAQFAELRSGSTISVTSTNVFGHTHTVDVLCA